MDFYFISPELINYLKEYETKERGFTKVPNIEYDENHNPKFFIGTVLQIRNYKYFAPMSHYKFQKPNNVLINIQSDKKNPIKGSIRLNYMFPVKNEYLTKLKINNITDYKYKRLLMKELNFCNNNEELIEYTALNTYINVILKTDSDLINNSCSFSILEQAIDNLPPHNTNEAEDSDKGLTLV